MNSRQICAIKKTALTVVVFVVSVAAFAFSCWAVGWFAVEVLGWARVSGPDDYPLVGFVFFFFTGIVCFLLRVIYREFYRGSCRDAGDY